MGEETGVKALAGAAKDAAAPERLRVAACEALGRIGGEEAYKGLVDARKGADSVFKRRTDAALARAHASVEKKAADKPKESGPTKDEQVKELFTKADGLRLAGKHDEAIEAYTEALGLAPDAVEGKLGRGLAWLAFGDAAKAERDFKAVVDAGGATRGTALLNRAEARRRLRKYDGALADLDDLVRGEPGNAVAHLARAAVHLEKGGPGAAESAVAAADRALEAKPGYAEALQTRAEAKLLGGQDLAGALADAEAALATDPEKPEFLLVRARVRIARGLAGMALQDAEKALDRAPAGGPLSRIATAVHGDAALRTGDHATARADFRRLATEEPDSPDNWYDLARAEAALGNADAACDALEKAVSRGHPAARLRGDPELKFLEGNARFEKMAGGK
ncbi:MAG: tetratricopeptide repeat protein [Planctomycetales bacterium]|nr:tetratricopeptide repeat protein [Planctomycetales bacterium]